MCATYRITCTKSCFGVRQRRACPFGSTRCRSLASTVRLRPSMSGWTELRVAGRGGWLRAETSRSTLLQRYAQHGTTTMRSGHSVVEGAVGPTVVDASVIVDLLVNGHPLPPAGVLVAPAHMDAEVLSALGRLHRHAVLTATDVEEMLDDLAALAVERLPLPPLLRPAFALRTNIALRDALYVTLAQVLGATLCTTDAPLARACTEQQLCAVSGVAPGR